MNRCNFRSVPLIWLNSWQAVDCNIPAAHCTSSTAHKWGLSLHLTLLVAQHSFLLHCTKLYWTEPHHTALHWTAPHRTTLYWTELHHTALHCTTLHCTTAPQCTTEPHFNDLHNNALHNTELRWTASHFSSLHCTTLHGTTLHFTAQNCSELHYTAQKKTLHCTSSNLTPFCYNKVHIPRFICVLAV